MKKIIVSVTNDLISDQRVDRVCHTLCDLGFDVLLIGRKLKNSLPLNERIYKTKRFRLLFNSGACFYANYNLTLFIFLLFHHFDVLVANDLDTLLANYLASKLKNKKIVYDSHEFFTGVPELEKNKFAKSVWTKIEKFIFPKLQYIFTVNDSIAALYNNLYKKNLVVVRNVPFYKEIIIQQSRQELNLPTKEKIILLQGAGINIDRGAEEAVMAMKYVQNAVLLIIGGGDVIDILKETTEKENLQNKVLFIPKMPFDKLFNYTVHADIGLSLDKNSNINYRYSLPNKIFDYIQAGVPLLVSPLIEIEKIVDEYQIGKVIENYSPENIADKINNILSNEPQLLMLKANVKRAAKKLCWENEKNKLINIYKDFL